MDLAKMIRDVPDFPKEGVIFKDITTLIKDPEAFKKVIDLLTEHYTGRHIDLVVAVEARGYIFGAPVAYKLGAGFVPVRKEGKLPAETVMHRDAIQPGQKVLIVDDLVATGGSAAATARLVERLGGEVVGIAFLIELTFLKGVERLKGYDVFTVIEY
jgi:adenine phosphoribosyltransferase